MKNIIYIALTLFIGLGLMTGCEEEEPKVTIDLTGKNTVVPVMTNADTGSGELSEEIAAEVFEVFEWSAADYDGVSVAVKYNLKIDINADFSTATDLGPAAGTEEHSMSITVKQVNDAAIILGAATGEEVMLYIKVVSQIIGVSESAVSTLELTRTVTPYEVVIDFPMIYVPGAYQGWSPGADNGRLYSYEFNTIYEGIIRITTTADQNGEFKLTPEAKWDVAWGGTLTKTGSNYAGTTDGGDNFVVTPATYMFKVDTDKQTIQMTSTDDWGIIGDATPSGWDADTDMYYNGQLRVWEITLDMVVGGFKFRANDGWDLNKGGDALAGELEYTGDGNYLLTEAGNYTITMDLINSTYSLVKN